MNTKYVVLAMEACPLEVDEIRRILRRRDLLGELYYQPQGVTDITDFYTKNDFFGNHSGGAIRVDGYWGPLLVINPTPEFDDSRRIRYFRSDPDGCPMTVIHGNSRHFPGTSIDVHPPAILQLCANLGEFPERRHQLIARFARNRYYLGDDVTKSEEDWLFSHDYRLQGITSEQEEEMRDAWAIEHKRAVRTIFSPVDNCTPFYDYDVRGIYNVFALNVISTPNRLYLMGLTHHLDRVLKGVNDWCQGQKLIDRLIPQRARASADFKNATWSDYYDNTRYPGGLPFPARLRQNGDRPRYLEFTTGADTNEFTLSLVEDLLKFINF